MIRKSDPAAAGRLWAALQSGRMLSARDAAQESLASEVYARKTMRAWAEAGYANRLPPETRARDAVDHYVIAAGAPKDPPIVTTEGEVAPRTGYMSAHEFAAARRRSGLNQVDFGRRLGRTGADLNVGREIRRYETGARLIDKSTADKVRALSSPS